MKNTVSSGNDTPDAGMTTLRWDLAIVAVSVLMCAGMVLTSLLVLIPQRQAIMSDTGRILTLHLQAEAQMQGIEAMQPALASLEQANPYLLYAAIQDVTATAVAHSNPHRIGMRFPDPGTLRCLQMGEAVEQIIGLDLDKPDSPFHGQQAIDLQLPIRKDGRIIGVVRTGWSMERFNADTRFYLHLVGSICALWIAVVALTIWMRIRSARRLRLLHRQATRAEELFRSVFAHAPEAMLITRLEDGIIIDGNDSWQRQTGWPIAEVVGRPIVELKLLADDTQLRHWLELKRGGAQRLELPQARLRRRDGTFRTIALSGQIIDSDGEPHLITTAVDISDSLARETALRDANQRLADAEKQARFGTFWLELPAETGAWSAGMRELHGLGPDDPLPLSIAAYLSFVHPDDRARFVKAGERFRSGEVQGRFQYRIIVAGRVRWIESCRPQVIALDGGRRLCQVTVIDITERRLALDQVVVQEREAVIGRMAGRVAHEVNNPLEAIKALVEPLRRRSAALPDVAEGLAVIDRQVDRIAKLVRALLGLVRQQTIHRSAVRPAEIIATVGELFRPRFAKAGKNLRLLLPEESRLAMIDADQIQQVVINLLENALAAIPTGGSVDLTLEQAHPWIEIRVEDDGPGLGEDPERLFQPFFTTKPSGTGLGLAVSRSICLAHQGEISAANRQPRGACFRVRLHVDVHDESRTRADAATLTGEIQV